jgi:hypothetical protein
VGGSVQNDKNNEASAIQEAYMQQRIAHSRVSSDFAAVLIW